LKRPSRSFKVIVFDKERISSVETMAPSQSYRFRDISVMGRNYIILYSLQTASYRTVL